MFPYQQSSSTRVPSSSNASGNYLPQGNTSAPPLGFSDSEDEPEVPLPAIQWPIVKNKIFVGGLTEDVSIRELRDHFVLYGPLEDVSIHMKVGKRPYGFVTFEHASGFIMALQVTHKNWRVKRANDA